MATKHIPSAQTVIDYILLLEKKAAITKPRAES
jgi:hypothetical protein